MKIEQSSINMTGSREFEFMDRQSVTRQVGSLSGLFGAESFSSEQSLTGSLKTQARRTDGDVQKTSRDLVQTLKRPEGSASAQGVQQAMQNIMDRVAVSREGLAKLALDPARGTFDAGAVGSVSDDMFEVPEDPQLRTMIQFLESLTGKKIHLEKGRFKLVDPSKAAASNGELKIPVFRTPAAAPQMQADGAAGEDMPENMRPGLVNQIQTTIKSEHYEHEKMTFETQGQVQTADGKTIDLNLSLSMSREFYSQNEQTFSGFAMDPLVVNFDGKAADLTETTYAFDLNSDGLSEQIAFVKPNSGGFLAYDRNGDGVVNDGSELFGPSSGNGFADLAAYDDDGNGWIDEQDAVYYDLAVWSKDEAGNDRLTALADLELGAIYLNALNVGFQVKDADNQLLGQVRSNSIYLNEDGSAGTIQQVDLAVNPPPQPIETETAPT